MKFEQVPWERVAKQVRRLADDIDAVLATAQRRLERNNRNVVLFNLGASAMRELHRVSVHLEESIEDLAWSVRNLHEIDLTMRFVAANETNVADWSAQMLTDEKDVVEGFLQLSEMYPADETARLTQRLRTIEETATRLGLDMQRPWSMQHLARSTGREREYRLFYRFFSKFVHPSSWLVNGRRERTDTSGYRNLIVGLAQVLAQRVHRILLDEYELRDEDVVPGAKSEPWTPL